MINADSSLFFLTEETAEAILTAIGDGVTIHDRDFRIVYQNRTMIDLFGDHTGEICHRTYWNREIPCVGCPLENNFSGGEVYRGEREVELGGERLVLESTATALRQKNGEITAAVEVYRNVTQRKKTEENLIRFSNLYKALSHTNRAIMYSRDSDSLFREICRIAVDYGKFCLASVGIPDGETGLFRSAACSGSAQEYLDSVTSFADSEQTEARGPCGAAFREGMACICNDLDGDTLATPWRDAASKSGIRSLAVFPLSRRGEPAGVFNVYAEERGFFDDDIIRLLREMAANISFALDNFSRDDQRRKAQEGLRESEERLKLVLEGSNNGFWDWDLATGAINLSARYVEMLGYAPGEIAPQVAAVWKLIHREDRPRVMKTLEDHFSGASSDYEIEFRIRTKCGDWAWVHDHGKVVARSADGAARRLAGISCNISERKRYEENLRFLSTHDSLTGLFNRMYFETELSRLATSRHYPVSIVVADVDGLKGVNDTFGHAEGDRLIRMAARALREAFRAEDIVARIGGDEFAVLLPETDVETVRQAVKRVLNLQGAINEENSDYSLSISIGAATAWGGAELDEAFKLADARMYYYKLQRRSGGAASAPA